MNRLRALWETILNLLRPPTPPAPPIKGEPLRYLADLKGMAAIRKVQFVIRLADGRYYIGPGLDPGTIKASLNKANAQRFGNRWQALTVCTGGPVFALSAIVEAGEDSEAGGKSKNVAGLPPLDGIGGSKG